MLETIAPFFFFFSLSFLSGLFWPAFHAMIGAPEMVPDESAGLGAQFVKTLRISKPGMIFRRYGEWLCRKQNDWEKKYDKSLLHKTFFPTEFQAQISFLEVETSFGRGMEVITEKEYNGRGWIILAKLFPGEQGKIKWRTEKKEKKEFQFFQVYPDFDRSKMPLSPYKALGLCSNCAAFWIMLATLIPACFCGLFPASFFWLILPAYGLAMWGTTVYE